MTDRRNSKHLWRMQVEDRLIFGSGLPRRFFGDLFHQAMTISWAQMVIYYFSLVFGVSLLFAVLYALGPNAVTGAHPPSFAELFFFSVEVFGTVSFGGFQPSTNYGHTVASIEIMFGIGSYAVMTGLAFARFARPKAHLLFTKHPIITEYQGRPTLMLRLANARHNYISDAHAKIWLLMNDRPDPKNPGSTARRFYRMALLRDESPLFILSWTLYHPIDEQSPLYGMSEEDFEQLQVQFAIIIIGYDENYGQEIRARHVYRHDDLRWDHHYVDIISQLTPEAVHIDYSKFHDIKPKPSDA